MVFVNLFLRERRKNIDILRRKSYNPCMEVFFMQNGKIQSPPVPTARTLDFLDDEFGLFFHFGIRTFNEDNRDWDHQEMPLSSFCPTALDCGQWLRCAQ